MALKEYVDRAKADYDEVFEAGKKSEYDKFWDTLQQNGERKIYLYAFYDGGHGTNLAKWFYPKYDIKPTRAEWFMRDAKMFEDGTKYLDLVERLNECGVTMDFSECEQVSCLFYNAKISHLPEINITKAVAGQDDYLFGSCIEKVDKFIFNKVHTLKSAFLYASSLKDIVFEGVYEAGEANLRHSTALSKDSLISFINCLSTEISGKAITLSLKAVNKAFETTEGANNGSTSSEWLTLTGTKSNWTISLV